MGDELAKVGRRRLRATKFCCRSLAGRGREQLPLVDVVQRGWRS